ncbi:bcl-2-related protein A1-like [Apodemus sylvaticus]|uniref:bcl-2-related protein A1-like n=1 Tax=Apodemus sylvaticus TaxID=10129 RepID=UPI0022447BC3|nr:bcl-2-related protein A1-like [Apodemus sylvaticus]XP_052045164.1 bcl-2-related protein A1-like [Apodemus sylvaticus]
MRHCQSKYIHFLAENNLQYVLQAPAFELTPSETSRVLQRVAFSVQKEVEKKQKPFLNDFHVESIDTARIIFSQVMEKVFEDGIINCRRIVTIFAFAGVLLKKTSTRADCQGCGCVQTRFQFCGRIHNE